MLRGHLRSAKLALAVALATGATVLLTASPAAARLAESLTGGKLHVVLDRKLRGGMGEPRSPRVGGRTHRLTVPATAHARAVSSNGPSPTPSRRR